MYYAGEIPIWIICLQVSDITEVFMRKLISFLLSGWEMKLFWYPEIQLGIGAAVSSDIILALNFYSFSVILFSKGKNWLILSKSSFPGESSSTTITRQKFVCIKIKQSVFLLYRLNGSNRTLSEVDVTDQNSRSGEVGSKAGSARIPRSYTTPRLWARWRHFHFRLFSKHTMILVDTLFKCTRQQHDTIEDDVTTPVSALQSQTLSYVTQLTEKSLLIINWEGTTWAQCMSLVTLWTTTASRLSWHQQAAALRRFPWLSGRHLSPGNGVLITVLT